MENIGKCAVRKVCCTEVKERLMQMSYQTIQVKLTGNICFIKFIGINEKNCITNTRIEEVKQVFENYQDICNVIVLEGNDSYFCFGADFDAIGKNVSKGGNISNNPAPLFDLWKIMTESSCIVISHVRGAVNAGGMGFVSASDIVISSRHAVFSLSELLFGLMPAMVLPFLIRRIGFSKANYLTLTTKPINSETAYNWGLIDVCTDNSVVSLRQTLARLSKIPKDGILRYKRYMNKLRPVDLEERESAIDANLEVFNDPVNLKRIADFSNKGIYPWEEEHE